MGPHVQLNVRDLPGLLSEVSQRMGEDGRVNFRIICLTSDLSIDQIVERFPSSFTVTEKGKFYQISESYIKLGKKFEVYLYLFEHPELGVPMIFTLNSSEDFKRTAASVITQVEELYYLWMPPNKIEGLKEQVLSQEGSRLTKFRAKKFNSERRYEKERRPDILRKPTYEGEDAAQTLEEWKMEYGISPTKLHLELPTKAEFHFNNEGEFVLTKGDPDFFFEEIVCSAVASVKDMNDTIQASRMDLVENNGVQTLEKQSLEITVSNALDYEDYDDLRDQMEEDDFYPYHLKAAQGSLLLTGRLVDEENGGMISVSSDGKTFSVLPEYDSGFDSLMRFYRFVIEKVDSDADVQLAG